jgi:hypothetical protein
LTSKTFQTCNPIERGLIQLSSCWISYEHLQQKGKSTNQNGHDLHLIKKKYWIVRESDGEVGRAVVW